MLCSKTCSALSNQYDSELFSEKRRRIVFNLLAKTDAFRLGLFNGLYLYFPPNSKMIKSSVLLK